MGLWEEEGTTKRLKLMVLPRVVSVSSQLVYVTDFEWFLAYSKCYVRVDYCYYYA